MKRQFFAHSVTRGLGGPFKVSAGSFASEQTMGWHITDEKGFTVAVSCDSDFVERLGALSDPIMVRDQDDYQFTDAFGNVWRLVRTNAPDLPFTIMLEQRA